MKLNRLGAAIGIAAPLVMMFGINSALAQQANDVWRYVSEDHQSRNSQKTVWLTEKPVQGVEYKFGFPGKIRYGILQYGSTQSRYLSLAVVEADSETKLFLDLDRDQVLDATEELTCSDGVWETPVAAEIPKATKSEPEMRERQVQFRLNRFGKSISFSTVGYAAGNLTVADSKDAPTEAPHAGTTFSARITDTNNNGRFGDASDLLWVDQNRDARFNTFTEKSSCQKGLRIEGQRYQLVANENAFTFALHHMDGNGKIEFVLGNESQATVANLLLVGKDGTSVAVQLPNWNKPVTESLPTGEYRIASLSLTSINPVDQEEWHYTFSGYQTGENAKWYSVDRGETTRVNPLENLRFEVNVDEKPGTHRPGERLRLTPTLYASSGLVLNNCWQGKESLIWIQEGKGATLRLCGGNLMEDVVATSGFK